MPTYFSVPEKPVGGPAAAGDPRPGALRSTQSFSRLDPSPARSLSIKQAEAENLAPTAEAGSSPENSDDEDGRPEMPTLLPEGFGDLPPDIAAFCDKFLDSLSQKTFPTPITGDHLSDLYQEFYLSAFDLIRSHISSQYVALSSKKKKANASGPETQMLSISEISQKKKDRRMLGAKRLAMEEALEARATQKLYDKIWRHKSTDDEARDDSLRSKTETLKVVGVKLEHLGVLGVDDQDMIDALTPAREALYKMTTTHTPLGKLDLLRQAHKFVVDTLVSRNSDSSADRILPTLIFCLIHSPPSITVISDLFFVQRFRAKKAIDGEAAYCLTNLEAAICFLETVDLATLKIEGEDEPKRKRKSQQSINDAPSTSGATGGATDSAPTVVVEGAATKRTQSRGRRVVRELVLPDRDRSETPYTPADDPLSNLSGKLLTAQIDHSLKVAEMAWELEVSKTPSPRMTRFPDNIRNQMSNNQTPPPASPLPPASADPVQRHRALSYLINNPVVDVAGTVVSTADVGIKTIGTTLESSYKFLFGKMDEKKAEMPKTLEDARKLVEHPPSPSRPESIDEARSVASSSSSPPPPLPPHPSVSARPYAVTSSSQASNSSQTSAPAAAFAAMGTSFTRMSGINVMRGFTRSSSAVSLDKEKEKTAAAAAAAATAVTSVSAPRSRAQSIRHEESGPRSPPPPVNDLLSTFPELASPLLRHSGENLAAVTAAGAGNVESEPPLVNERFLAVKDAGELRISEVEELLREYKRLALFARGVQISGEGR
ncbi:hypothetical protein DFH27DRAFT_565827 [Peziza echinospora]|nr:hypothetical protein DFH27DRAFT_565827 [Peziza echinospora]